MLELRPLISAFLQASQGKKTASQVVKVSGLAGELIDILPTSGLLPGNAQSEVFRQGLTDLRQWHPDNLPDGVSARGDPIRRWMIRKIGEEFYYSFNQVPPTALVGDLIRLGWPDMSDRSIRNTLDDVLWQEIMRTVNTRREIENRAMASAQLEIAKATSKASRESTASIARQAAIQNGDEGILAEMQRLAEALTDDYARNRLLSNLKATRDEAGYPQEEPDEGNQTSDF